MGKGRPSLEAHSNRLLITFSDSGRRRPFTGSSIASSSSSKTTSGSRLCDEVPLISPPANVVDPVAAGDVVWPSETVGTLPK